MMHIVYDPYFDRAAENRFISLSKPAAFFNAVVRDGSVMVHSVDINPFDLDLKAIHSPEYVDGVFNLEVANGYGNKEWAMCAHAAKMCGVMVEASLLAMETGEPVCAPVQGFHHAHYDMGYGYCTFNGLLLAAHELRKSGFTEPILILDCDGHKGDGTFDILDKVSMPGVMNLSYERDNYNLDTLQAILLGHPTALVMYQAGADSHEDDPYGAGYLSTRQMRDRDHRIFSTCKRLGNPIVWNLAGGYSDPSKVLNLHLQTAAVCREIYDEKRV